MLGGGKFEGAYLCTLSSPQLDQLICKAVVESGLGRIGDDRDRSGLRRRRTGGLEHSSARLEQRGIGPRREARVTVLGADLVFQRPVPPDVEVGQHVRKACQGGQAPAGNGAEPEHRRDQHRPLDSFAALGEMRGQNTAEGQARDGESVSQAGSCLPGPIGHRDQHVCTELRDRGGQAIRIAVPGISGNEDIPAQIMEVLAQRVELLRAVREPVKQDERALGSVPMGVEACAAGGVDVGTVQRFQAFRDLDSRLVGIAAHRRTGY